MNRVWVVIKNNNSIVNSPKLLNVFRDDVVEEAHFKDAFLRETPHTEGGYVKVKQIL